MTPIMEIVDSIVSLWSSLLSPCVALCFSHSSCHRHFTGSSLPSNITLRSCGHHADVCHRCGRLLCCFVTAQVSLLHLASLEACSLCHTKIKDTTTTLSCIPEPSSSSNHAVALRLRREASKLLPRQSTALGTQLPRSLTGSEYLDLQLSAEGRAFS